MEQYSIGRVFSRTLAQLRSNFWTLLGFVVLGYIASVIVNLIVAIPFVATLAASDSNPAALMFSLVYLVYLLVNMVIGFLVYGFMYAGAFHSLSVGSMGQRVTLGDCCSIGIRKALPMFLLILLIALGTLLGYLLLIIPGVIVALMWSVAMPVLVLEDRGALEALGRSRALTSGLKINIFLTHLAVLAVALLVYAVIAILFVVFGGSLAALTAGATPWSASTVSPALLGMGLAGFLGFFVFLIVWPLVVLAMFSLQVSIYREVKLVKEGSDGGVVDVFR